MTSQDARLSKFEADFKQQQSEMTNKIDTLLKAINDRMTEALPSDTVKNPKLNVNPTSSVLFGRSYPLEDPQRDSNPFKTLADLGSCVNLIPLYLFKTLNIGILEEIENVLGLANGTKSHPVGIVKNVEVYVGKLKLLDDFYIIDMEKDPTCPLLIGRGFLATAGVVIDCNKAKIEIGKGVTRTIFGVKEIGLGYVDTPYWTTLSKWKSYES
ncbi:MAK10-like protein [Tanacetum coccineum]